MKKEQTDYYPVIVDGLCKQIFTQKEQITVAKCKNIVKNVVEKFGVCGNIQILMSEYNLVGVCQKNKNAYYCPEKNRLVIYQDGRPIYENYDGAVCRDADALADCLM